jgi:hypothetical protein
MRRVLVVSIATLFLLVGAGVARADHTHVLILPNGNCAILAADGEREVSDPPGGAVQQQPERRRRRRGRRP